MPIPRHRSSCLIALVLVCVGSACAGDLPISERIVGVRPLGVRVEARGMFLPEPTDRPPRTEALPLLDQIEVTPFFVDEQGPLSPERIETELEPLWLACPMQPIQGLFACLSGRLPLELEDIEDCPPIDLLALDPESLDSLSIPAPCRITEGTPAAPSMQVPLDFNFLLGGDLELTMIAHRPDTELTTEECAGYLLGEQAPPRDCLYLTQRASIASVGALIEAVEGLGVSGFEPPGEELLGEQPEPVPDFDLNTRIESFRVIVTDEQVKRDDFVGLFAGSEAIDVAAGDTLTVKAGQTIAIETIAPDRDRQFFPIPASRDEEGEIDPDKDLPCCVRWYDLTGTEPAGTAKEPEYPDCPTTTTDTIDDDYVVHLSFGETFGCRVENYVGDWYRTWGTMLSHHSDDSVSYNTWQMIPGEQDDMESDLPPDGLATIYYVLRDDRQGVSWFWFHVMVTP